ncbi:MAG: uroporphyrinogen decarboxylase [Flavobacteriales bacterium]
MEIVELIGYLASAVVLGSFLMKDMRKLRKVNSAGCFLFVVYGVLLAYSWPIIITNVAILSINLFYLIKKSYE